MEDVNALKKVMSDYSDEVPPAKKQRRDICVHSWRYEDVNGQLHKEGDILFLSKENCELVAIANASIGENHELLVDSKPAPAPTAEELMAQVYSYLLNLEFQIRLKTKCEGCKYDLYGQSDHMQGGCLDTLTNQVDAHGEKAHFRVSAARVVHAFENIAKYMDVNLSIEYWQAERYVRTVDYSALLKTDKQPIYYNEFGELDYY